MSTSSVCIYCFTFYHVHAMSFIRKADLVLLILSMTWLYFYISLWVFSRKKKIMDGSKTDANFSRRNYVSVGMYIHIQYVLYFILTASAVLSSWAACISSSIGFPLQYQLGQTSDIICLTGTWVRLHEITSNSKTWGTQSNLVQLDFEKNYTWVKIL